MIKSELKALPLLMRNVPQKVYDVRSSVSQSKVMRVPIAKRLFSCYPGLAESSVQHHTGPLASSSKFILQFQAPPLVSMQMRLYTSPAKPALRHIMEGPPAIVTCSQPQQIRQNHEIQLSASIDNMGHAWFLLEYTVSWELKAGLM